MINAYVNEGNERPFISLSMVGGKDYDHQFTLFWPTTPAELRKLADELEAIKCAKPTRSPDA